jgi:tetratricopeptide (TPR) repeat protein
MLAKIALAKRDPDAAREEAGLASVADPTLPLPIFIDARLLYDQGKYADALPGFMQAIGELKKSGTLQITELHFYAADTLARLERYPEAEKEFIEELKYARQSTRARGGLAMLPGQRKARGGPHMLDDMIRVTPAADSYALAARLHTMFNRKQAEAVKAEAGARSRRRHNHL